MHLAKLTAAAAAAMLLAQPALAADDMRFVEAGTPRSSAFAGLSVSLPLDARTARGPTARLQLTASHAAYDARGATLRSNRGQGLELGLDRLGRPELFAGGVNLAQEQKRLGASGSTKWIIIGGVVVAVVVLAAAFASAQPTAGPPPGAF
jgi:hypothetical protein